MITSCKNYTKNKQTNKTDRQDHQDPVSHKAEVTQKVIIGAQIPALLADFTGILPPHQGQPWEPETESRYHQEHCA